MGVLVSIHLEFSAELGDCVTRNMHNLVVTCVADAFDQWLILIPDDKLISTWIVTFGVDSAKIHESLK